MKSLTLSLLKNHFSIRLCQNMGWSLNPIQYPEQQFNEFWLLTYCPLPNTKRKFVDQHCNSQSHTMVPSGFKSLWTASFIKNNNDASASSLLKTITMHLHHPNIQAVAKDITCNCDACQPQMLPGPQHAHLPPQEAALVP
jgi:hypothetical protein